MCKIFAVVMQKGGVAKTTTALNLGIGLARKGKHVLMVDFGPDGNLTTCLGWQDPENLKHTVAEAMKDITEGKINGPVKGILRCREGVDLLPANSDLYIINELLFATKDKEHILKRVLAKLTPDYDYIIIDSLSTFGVLMINVLTAADKIIIPMTADLLSFEALASTMFSVSLCRRNLNKDLKIAGVLLTMVRRDNNYMKDSVADIRAIMEEKKIPIYDTFIPFSICFEVSAYAGESIYISGSAPRECKQAYSDFVDEVLENEQYIASRYKYSFIGL